MPSRKERRQEAHKARKLARKAGFPTSPVVAAQPTSALDTMLHTMSAKQNQPEEEESFVLTPAPEEKPRLRPMPPAVVAEIMSTNRTNDRGIHEPGIPYPSLAHMAAPTTPRQQEASRINGAKSKGPLTPETRAISAQNHTSHGLARHQNGTFKLLPFEDLAIFEALKQSLLEEHEPETQTELILVHNMAESQWLAQRSQHFQDSCFHPETGEIIDERKLSLYMRYQTTHTRAFHKCLNDLLRLRKENRQSALGFEAHRIANERHQMKKDLHYWKVLKEDVAATDQLSDLTLKNYVACKENPEFKALYEAELAARGLKRSAWEAATRVA